MASNKGLETSFEQRIRKEIKDFLDTLELYTTLIQASNTISSTCKETDNLLAYSTRKARQSLEEISKKTKEKLNFINQELIKVYQTELKLDNKPSDVLVK